MAPSLERHVKVWHLVLGLAIAILGGMFTAGMAWAGIQGRVGVVESKVDSHDTSIKNIEKDTSAIKSDVAWIRGAMEPKRKG